MKRAERHYIVERRMPRSRGAVIGFLLVVLGAWGALIPFVGPHFNFAYAPDREWAWTSARGWLEVFPGVTTAVGGLLLLVARSRAIAMLGGWLAVLAGAWFIVGDQVAPTLRIGSVGDPVAATDRKRALLEVTYFSGLGALIVFLGGVALARVAARLARDIEPYAPVAPAAAEPTVEPYRDAPAYEPEPAAVHPGAVTVPRMEKFPVAQTESRFRRGFRRHDAGAAAGGP